MEEFERMETVKEETESSEKGLVKKAKQGTFIRVLEENSGQLVFCFMLLFLGP